MFSIKIEMEAEIDTDSDTNTNVDTINTDTDINQEMEIDACIHMDIDIHGRYGIAVGLGRQIGVYATIETNADTCIDMYRYRCVYVYRHGHRYMSYSRAFNKIPVLDSCRQARRPECRGGASCKGSCPWHQRSHRRSPGS